MHISPFHTSNEEDHKRSPVWHNDSDCEYGKRIKPENKEYGKKGNRCDRCKELNSNSN